MSYTAAQRSRFWGHVDSSGGQDSCWPWLLGVDKDGYGKVKIAGTDRRAHAVAVELTDNITMRGKLALHRCDNPGCCNPAHLFVGTHADNMHDKTIKNRQSRMDNHGRALLSPEIVVEARKQYISGSRKHGCHALARKYGVSYTTMYYALNGRNWKSL